MRLLPERDCTDCRDKPDQRIRWGCDADAQPPIPIQFGDERTLRCPRRPYLDDQDWFNRILEAYDWMEKGFLPNPGTWRDQDNRFISFCNVIEGAKVKADAIAEKAQESKRTQASKAAKKPGGRKPTHRSVLG